jgi:hypothetical protein
LRNTHIIIGILTFLLVIPSAEAKVTGITLQAAPNVISIEWQAPMGTQVSKYKVYYAHESILENNGRFDDAEETVGSETSLVLMDMKNRGFTGSETIFVTVTPIDANGQEHMNLAEEESTTVNIPGSPTHSAPTVGLSHAISQTGDRVLLHFSGPVLVPETGDALFTITNDTTGEQVEVLSLNTIESDVLLTTAPLTARTRYTVQVSNAVSAADGTELDSGKLSAVFIARGDATAPQAQPPAAPAEPAPAPLPPAPSAVAPALPDEPTGAPSPMPEAVPAAPLPPAPLPTPPVSSPTPGIVPPQDVTPPEDATQLTLEKVLQSDGNYTVRASWQESLNSAGDLASYHLYESKNRGIDYVGPAAIRSTVTSTTIANVPPGTLTLKITASDHTGNESEGVEEMIILPETGAAMALLLSAGGAFTVARRRRKLRIN